MTEPPPVMPAKRFCFNHPIREAAALCVGCGRPFCRECITPVVRRMYCTACHQEKMGAQVKPKRDWFVLSVAVQAALGFFGLWFTAYMLGRVLLEIPSDFHEGTVWLKYMP